MSAVTELIQRGPAEALAGLLGVPMPEDELPLFWHWVYLLDRPAQRELGRDGHVAAGVEPGRRRMFAGGEIRSLGAAALRRARDAPHRRCSTRPRSTAAAGGSCSRRSASRSSSATRSWSTSARRSSTATCRPGRRRTSRSSRPGRRGRVVDRDHAAPAVPLLRADLQRPPHPLRPRLRARGRGLPRARHPRPAAGARDGRGRPRPRVGHGVRVPARRAALRAPGPVVRVDGAARPRSAIAAGGRPRSATIS